MGVEPDTCGETDVEETVQAVKQHTKVMEMMNLRSMIQVDKGEMGETGSKRWSTLLRPR